MFIDLVGRSLFIFALVATGAIARKREVITDAGLSTLTNLFVTISYPAVVLAAMMEIEGWEAIQRNIALPLVSMGIMLIGFLIGLLLKPFLVKRGEIETRSTFLFHCTVNNYVFMALPIVSHLYGEAGIIALAFMNIGANIILTTLGFWILGGMRSEFNFSALKRMFNPPLIATVLGLCIVVFWPIESRQNAWGAILLKDIFQTLGSMTVPLVMIFAGASMMNTGDAAPLKTPIYWTTVALRILIIPFVTLLALRWIPLPAAALGTCMISAVMPSSMASSTWTRRFGGNQNLNDWLATGTTALSLVTVPLILHWAGLPQP